MKKKHKSDPQAFKVEMQKYGYGFDFKNGRTFLPKFLSYSVLDVECSLFIFSSTAKGDVGRPFYF